MLNVLGISTSLAAGVSPEALLSHVLPHQSFIPFLTNLQLMGVFVAVLVFLTFRHVASRVEVNGDGVEDYVTKGRFAQFFETICIFVREEIARPALGHLTDKYIYYIWTVFFFIFFSNIIGLIPFGAMLELVARAFDSKDPVHFSHLFGGTATGTLTMNAPLALMSFVAIVFIGLRENGLGFIAHFAPVPIWPIQKNATPGLLPVAIMLVFLEILGLIIKCVVLAMRLFGTMLAGHLVIAALLGLIGVAAGAGIAGELGVGIGVLLAGVALSLLELFICMLQAFIFTFLTVLFIASGAVHHDEEHHGHGPGHDHAHGDPAHNLEEAALVHAVEHA